MANHTLLDAINETLKRVNIISGTASNFTSLTDAAQQHDIDVAVQVINEGIDELYSASHVELPLEGAESTIVLVLGQREYALASNLVKLIFPMIDRTNLQEIIQFEGSYQDFLLLDPQQVFTGLPIYGMISPITGLFRVERAPDAPSVGRTYTYEYEKDTGLVNATDTVPFNNAVFRSMVPAWAQLWKRERRNEFDGELYRMAIGRASRFISEVDQRGSWSPRHQGVWIDSDQMPW